MDRLRMDLDPAETFSHHPVMRGFRIQPAHEP